jgi:NAD(P)-dependent dehydrogenase (short-subunit alcohol dehydrogenase family)
MGQEVSVVVGAAEGMGLAVSERLARMHPGRLVLADVQGDKVAGVAERLRGAGADCVAVPMDLTDPNSMAELAQVAGVPTRVALVAGVHARHPALEMTEDLFFDVLRVNLVGVYLAAQTFAKRMIDAGVKGSIVAVTSVSARRPQPDMAAYVASKAAVTAALRVLGATVAPHGVRVNTVAPSATRTAMMRSDPERVGATIPLRRVNEPGDIADVVLFLLSDQSQMITMREIPVDGGSLLGM